MSHREWKFEVVGIEKITDGDTYWLRLDVGFRQTQLTHLRLFEYDTPEIWRPQSDFEKQEAMAARRFVQGWIDTHLRSSEAEVWATTHKDPDSFGRWLAELEAINEADEVVSHLGESLRAEGLASLWPMRWREEFDTGE